VAAHVSVRNFWGKPMLGKSQRSVLIAGGYGLIGRTLASLLRADHTEPAIVLAGRNPARGEKLAAELGNARTAHLDLRTGILPDELHAADLIVAAVQDPADRLIDAAIDHGIAHLGITKLANEIAPMMARAALRPPARPIVPLGHYRAGALVHLVRDLLPRFLRIDSVRLAAVYDPADTVGPMTASELARNVGTALIREDGEWRWIDADAHPRMVRLADGDTASGIPLGTLDVPSIAALTGASSVRFDTVTARSLGTSENGSPSLDLYVDVEGRLG
jgi:nucleoside-diphosphate-sugar epimerase